MVLHTHNQDLTLFKTASMKFYFFLLRNKMNVFAMDLDQKKANFYIGKIRNELQDTPDVL